jgi:drug/metabolite transporter (DMT)-like permease
MPTPVSSMAWVSIGSFIGSFGAVFLKAGAVRLELKVRSLVRNWQLAAGIFFFCLSSVFFVLGLRDGELSVLYPMVSLGYVWTLFWSRWFFGERLTPMKFAGLGLILAGVLMIGLGSERPAPSRVQASQTAQLVTIGH